MEENKDLFENENGEQTPEEPPVAKESSVIEETPVTEETPAVEEVPATESAALDFSFYAREEKKKGRGTGVFFAIFGGVVALCVALLVFVLFLGDGGIDIIKTLYNERVIYVRDEELATDLLTQSEAADKVRKSTVTVSVMTESGASGIGSGFVLDSDGHICTNYHVIEGARRVQVILPDGVALDAAVVGYDAISDLAVLKVEHEGLVPVELGSSADLLVGEEVVAIGTPAHINFAGTATFGRISYTNRLLPLTDSVTGSVYRKITVIQTDTSLNPGNSGGPMADMYGRVVGIVVRKVISYGGTTYEGMAFAIPIDGAKAILDAIIKNGRFEGDNPVAEGPSQLGLTGHTVKAGMWYAQAADGSVASSDTEREGYYYAEQNGVYTSQVSGTQASGRILVGDIILKINGLQMYSIQDVIAEVNRHYAGEHVTVTVWRDGASVDVEIRLGEGAVS